MTQERFYYLREDVHPIACVAIKLDGNTIVYQVSSISLQDKGYTKALGREIALKRLEAKPITIPLPTEAAKHSITYEVIKDIASHQYQHGVKSSLSRRILKAASDWLERNPLREVENV